MDVIFNLLFFGVFIYVIYRNVIKIILGPKNQMTSGNKLRCPGCAKMIDASNYTCPHCGTAVKKKCPNCGGWTYVGNATCPSCNKPLSDARTASQVQRQNQVQNRSQAQTQTQTVKNTYASHISNNDVKCTYHDTYSAGYNPDCKPDESYLNTPKTDYDNIGFVKGRGRSKVQTVDEYMRERHNEGAYHVNVNEVKSYDRKGSYGDYSSAVQENRKRGRKSVKSPIKTFKTIFVTVFVLIVVLGIGTSIISSVYMKKRLEDYAVPENQNHYASSIKDNIGAGDIASNAVAIKYFDEISTADASDGDIVRLLVSYDSIDNMYQFLLFRCSENTAAASNYIYYDNETGNFTVEEYLLRDKDYITNKYTLENGTSNYIQIDYFEYDIKNNEELSDNLVCLINGNDTDISYATSTEKIIPESVAYSRT